MTFSRQKILVTGASSGIGRCLAIKLANEGCQVVLCGRHTDRLNETKAMLSDVDKHQCLSFDIRDVNCYENLFDKAIEDGIKLTGFVHCAGIAPVTPIRMLRKNIINDIIDTNYTSFMCLVGMYSKRKYSDGGSIVALSAINAHYAQKYMSVYAASKAALEASIRSMAIELSAKNIRINSVVPGATQTPMLNNISPDELEAIVSRQALGIIPPEQIAEMILFLLSDKSKYITGREMYVDGGRLE